MSKISGRTASESGDNRKNLQLFSVQLSITLLIVGGVLLFAESRRLTSAVFEEAERQGVFLFSTMSQQVSDSLYFNDIEQIRRDAEILTTQAGVQQIAVFSETGRYLFDSSQVKIPEGFIDPGMMEMALQTSGSLSRWKANYLEFVGAIRFDGRLMGGLYFELDVSPQLEAVRKELLQLTVFGLLLIGLASGLSFAIAQTLGATRSLKAIESNFRELIEQSPLPTSMFDPAGNLTYFNPAFSRLIEKNPAAREIRNSRYNIFQDRVLHERRLLPRIETGFIHGPASIPRFRYASEDAAEHEQLWLTAVVFPLRQNDDSIREVVVIFQDVTAEKLAEDERASLNARILQSQKLEGLGVMARGIAHDFNNLLTPILGNAELIGAATRSDADIQKKAASIVSAAQHAADLCSQMLAYGGGGVRTKSLINVSEEVQALKELIRTSVSRRTRFTQQLDDTVPSVYADESQFRQVILNLLVNASEAISSENGEITLRTGVKPLDKDKARGLLPNPDMAPGAYVYLQVEDNGCGMTARTQQNIFNPFFTTKFTGRGLGMSAMLGIVGDHDGGIEVQSEPDKGSVFTVYFPVSREAREEQPPRLSEQTPEVAGRVLLVDDEPPVLNLGRQVLEIMGFQVVTAGNGREALQQYEAHHGDFTFLVLDLVMPVLDGESTLREIRKRDTQIPVIVVTGLISGETTERLASEPNVAILGKPYKMKDLENVISTVLRNTA